jgi:hypothetical protein
MFTERVGQVNFAGIVLLDRSQQQELERKLNDAFALAQSWARSEV